MGYWFDLSQFDKKADTRLKILPPVPNTKWRKPTVFPDLTGCSAIAIDLETKETDFEHGPGWGRGTGHIVGIAIAGIWPDNRRWKQYYPIAHEVEAEDNCDAALVLDWLKAQLTTDIPKIGANLQYDLGWLAASGIFVRGRLLDVQFAEALIDESALVNLEVIAHKYLRRGKTDDVVKDWIMRAYSPKVSEWRGELWRAPPRLVGPYAEDDADLPINILWEQWGLLAVAGQLDLFFMECDSIRMLIRMRLPGVNMDIARAEKLSDEITKVVPTLYEQLGIKHGYKIESANSADQLSKLFDHVGVTYPKTATGKPSFNKEWLEALEHPLGDEVLAIRMHEKIKSTFLDGYVLNRHVNGRIFCSFHPLKGEDGGAKTGRYSSSNPNLQNVPVRTKLGKRIRELFIPDYGHVCWHKKDHCVAPDTKILRSNMQHVPAEQVHVGMELVSFDEQSSQYRSLKLSTVTAVKKLKQPCYRVTTNNGVVVSSNLHRWLAKHSYSGSYQFMQTDQLKVGSMIPRVCDLWQSTFTYEDGWFAGLLDGEGWRVKSQLCFAQREGYVAERARNYMRSKNIQWLEKINEYNDCISFQIQGDQSEHWRVLASAQSIRLLHHNRDLIAQGTTAQSKWRKADIVQSIQYLGEQEVIGIETTAGTYIANGLMSHNSQIEYRLFAHFASGPGSHDIRLRYQNDPDTDYHWDTMVAVAPMLGKILASMTVDELATFRKPVKNINFGLLYGQTERSLAYKAGMSLADSREFFLAYHAARPFVKTTMKAIEAEVQFNGYIDTLLKRRVYFNQWEARDYQQRMGAMAYHDALRYYGSDIVRAFAYRAVNYRFQGSAADVLKKGMLDCYNSGVFDYTGLPKLQVHDELDWSQINDSPQMTEAFRYITHTLENAVKLSIPLKVDSGTGPNWAAIN